MLLREYRIVWLKLRLAWWRWAAREMGALHDDLPFVLRMVWDLHQEIQTLELRRRP